MQTTLGSFLNFQANCPYPTSTEYTFTAPFCNIQSVNPPVDAPISMQTIPSKEISNSFIAFSNFSPPRLTYFNVFPRTSISASVSKFVPALSSLCPSTKTFPSIIIVFAFSLDSASPFCTKRTSNLSFIVLTVPFCL